MKVTDNVISTVKPKEVEFDSYHVYVNSNITDLVIEPTEENPEPQIQYQYTVSEYDKDEFLYALSSGQLSLGSRTTELENVILDMSTLIYS